MALATNALTDVATCEDELGISSGTEDARLQRMINEASAIAESYAGRLFYRDTARAETVLGGEGPYLFLASPPVNSITSITFLGTSIDSGDYETYNANSGIVYAINGSWSRTGVIYDDISRTQVHGAERKTYTVTYDGGWYTPKQEDDAEGTRALPYDIEAAVLMIVNHLYRSRGRDFSVKSESLLQSSVTYSSGTTSQGVQAGHWLGSAVPGAAAILNRYKSAILR